MTTALEQAKQFIAACHKHGFTVEVLDNIVRIKKTFAPQDHEAYRYCDMYGYLLLEMVPLKGGSVWGTDGASVGGYVALTKGEFTLSKSGRGTKFIESLRKLLQ
jgi:hypothetical protein